MSQLSITEFADRLNEVMPEIMREFARHQVSEIYEGKITIAQMLVLEYLYSHGQCKMKDLAAAMRVSTAAMTGLVERLVREKYVARLFQANDRRIINIDLSAKGRDLVKKIIHQKREMAIKAFGRVSQQDRSDYLRILLQVKDILSSDNSNEK